MEYLCVITCPHTAKVPAWVLSSDETHPDALFRHAGRDPRAPPLPVTAIAPHSSGPCLPLAPPSALPLAAAAKAAAGQGGAEERKAGNDVTTGTPPLPSPTTGKAVAAVPDVDAAAPPLPPPAATHGPLVAAGQPAQRSDGAAEAAPAAPATTPPDVLAAPAAAPQVLPPPLPISTAAGAAAAPASSQAPAGTTAATTAAPATDAPAPAPAAAVNTGAVAQSAPAHTQSPDDSRDAQQVAASAPQPVGAGVGAGAATPDRPRLQPVPPTGPPPPETASPDVARADMLLDFPVVEKLMELHRTHLESWVSPWEWLANADGSGYTVMFRIYTRNDIARVLELLASYCGIGGSDPALPQCGTVVVVPVETGRPAYTPPVKKEGPDRFNSDELGTRLFVEPIIRSVQAGAALSFDYVALAVVASLLAGVGLATDNAVIIVASMLVSPIMGPILAMTFGTFILDWELVKLGAISESVALLLCVFVGGLVSLAMGKWAEDDDFAWPNPQMEDRGTVAGLFLGIAIAIPSGAGVALSVLGNNTSSLVGVAISASLLPPLVNSGMLWVHGLVNKYVHEYDEPVDRDQFVELGALSFALTAVNICCIFVAALVMFKVKEVAPIRGKSLLFSRTRFMRAVHIQRKQMVDQEEPVVSLEALRKAKNQLDQLLQGTGRRIGSVNDALATHRAVPLDAARSVYDVFNLPRRPGKPTARKRVPKASVFSHHRSVSALGPESKPAPAPMRRLPSS